MPVPSPATLTILRLPDAWLFQFHSAEEQLTPGILSALQPVTGEAVWQQQIENTVALLNRLISARTAGVSPPGTSADDPLQSLGRLLYNQLLPASIRTALDALAPGTPLRIFTNHPALPWELLHDDKTYLALKHPVARQMPVTKPLPHPAPPSSGLWRALLIGNPTQDLMEAEAEIEALAELITATPGAAAPRILMRQRASRTAVLEQIATGHFDLIHYSGHVHYDPAQPAASTLLLAAGEQLTAAEIEQNLAGSPLVFLNGCASGRGGEAGESGSLLYLGQATTGLANAVIQRGAKGFIGTFWPVWEHSSKEFALTFYRALLQGETLGRALQQTRRVRAEPADPLWASYLFYGDPSVVLLASQRAKARPVTLLTLHLTGGEQLYAHHALEMAAQQLKQALTVACTVVERYQGKIVNLHHTQLTAAFGLPDTQENDAERAIQAALGLVAELATTQQTSGGTLQCRIGLASGDLVVEPVIVNHEHPRYLAGEVLDEAAWLAAQAGVGEVWISEATRRLSHYHFRLVTHSQPLGATVRHAYRVVEPLSTAELIWQRPGYQTPLIGREAELDELQEIWQRCLQNRTYFVDVVGEAGSGKSRLIYELQQRLGASAIWLIATCPSTYAAGPYWLITQLLRALVAATPADDKRTIGEKLRQALPQDSTEDWAILGELLGVDVGTDLVAGSNAPDRQERQRQRVNLFEALLKQRATHTPFILLLEDFQWTDEASLDLLQHLAPRLENARLPLLILATWRSEADWQSPWHKRRNRREMQLGGLDESEGLALLTALLDGQPAPAEVSQLLLASAGRVRGNPFFIYELVTSLRATKALYFEQGRWRLHSTFRARQIPDVLDRLIRVRLHALPEPVQTILRLLAVADDICEYAVLKRAVAGTPQATQLDEGLKALEEKDLIYRRPERDAYSFYHALIQSVVYEDLHSDERRHLHRRIGRALQQLYDEQDEEVLALLAHHFYGSVTIPGLLGGKAMYHPEAEHADLQQAATYLRRAAHQALRRYALRQAALYFQQALDVSESFALDGPDRVRDLAGLGEAYELLGEYEQAILAYQAVTTRLTALPMTLEDRHTAADLARRVGRLQGWLGDFVQAHQHMVQALDLLGDVQSDQTRATAALIDAHTGSLYYLQGEMEQATGACQRALTRLVDLMIDPVAATALNVYGVVCEATGNWSQAVDCYERSCTIWALHNRYQLALVTDNLGTLYFYRGEFAKAEELYRQNLAFWQKMDAQDKIAAALLNLGSIQQIHGQWRAAQHNMRQALLIYRQINHPKWIALSHNNLGYLALLRGQPVRARVFFQHSIAVEPTAENQRGLAAVELAAGNLAQAMTAATLSLTLARQAGLAFEVGVSLRTVGLCHQAGGDLAAAQQVWEESLQILGTLGAHDEVMRTRVLLGIDR